MIQLPEKFAQDIQGKDTYLVPLIIIDNRLFLSTSKLTLGNQYYEPLLSSLGGIKESVDLQNKSFKISSISLEFYNYEYNNEFLSNRLFAPSVMNKRITIYYKSQSAESLDDSLQVYTGYIKNITENKDKLTLEAEDKTEQALHKELPIEYVRDDIDLPDKYKNAKVPLVYGSVEKAPCVYYDLYSTTVEDGSKDYSLTPDSFAIKEITNPYVFSDDSYLRIKQFSELFQDVSDGTLYSNATTQQYRVLGNRILIEKEVNVVSPDGGDISGITASTIAFNFVEVEHIGKITYSGGTHYLYYKPAGDNLQSRQIPIKMFKDIGGISPSTNIDEQPYLDVNNFSNIPEGLDGYWTWGVGLASDTYDSVFGENVINFESDKICNESNIVKDLDGKEVKSLIKLKFNLKTELELIQDEDLLPKLTFMWSDTSSDLWNISSSDAVLDLYAKQGEVNVETINVARNVFSIGQRKLDVNIDFNSWGMPDIDTTGLQSASMKYLKLDELQLIRTMILNNFINYDIYADVDGRVDNVQGKYTQDLELTSGERVMSISVQQDSKKPIKPFKPIKPIKAIKAIKEIDSIKALKPIPKLAKPIPSLIKPITLKGTKY
tara:strand:+ start:5891 stop:7705 length:1815 start_codon:yes stop_codon:yes gene_type:complete